MRPPPLVDGTIPTPRLPLRLGLAIAPAANRAGTATLPAALKNELLEKASAKFTDEKFLSEITVSPDRCLAGQSGFGALDGIARL